MSGRYLTSRQVAEANELVDLNGRGQVAGTIDYAYRQVGEGTPALVLLQHFRGNLTTGIPS